MKARNEQDEIDERVVAQADDDSAWEEPIYVQREETVALTISERLVARARFLASLHRESDVEKWLEQIIRERIEIEESVLANVRRELTIASG